MKLSDGHYNLCDVKLDLSLSQSYMPLHQSRHVTSVHVGKDEVEAYRSHYRILQGAEERMMTIIKDLQLSQSLSYFIHQKKPVFVHYFHCELYTFIIFVLDEIYLSK